MRPTNWSAWWLGRVAVFVFFAVAGAAFAADVLFPVPLHLVRRVEEPLSGSASEVEEFCSGNRLVTIAGSRTVIADYGAEQLIEIDRDAVTYSVTPFAELAAAAPSTKRQVASQASGVRDALTLRAAGVKASRSGRSADWFEIAAAGERGAAKLEVGVDRQITVSRAALDVLTGSAFPNSPSQRSEGIAAACRRTAAQATAAVDEQYGLPLEQVIAFEDDDDDEKRVVVRSSILSIDRDSPPPELVVVPTGARLVPSRRAQVAKSFKELDSGIVLPNRP